MYDRTPKSSYDYPAVNYGTGTTTRTIKGPKGARGRIAEALVSPTTSFVGTATPGKLQIGDGVTANLYLDLFVGAAGAGAAAGAPVRASEVTKIGSAAAIKGQDPTVLPFTYLPADTVLTVTFLAPTGGSPAGVADNVIEIEWGV